MFWPFPMPMPEGDVGSIVCRILDKKEQKLRTAVREKHGKRIQAFQKKEGDRLGLTKAEEALRISVNAKESLIDEHQKASGRYRQIQDAYQKSVRKFEAEEQTKEQKEISAIEKRFDDLKNRCLLELMPPKIRRIIKGA